MRSNRLQLGQWLLAIDSGELSVQINGEWQLQEQRLEPIGIKVLEALVNAEGQMLSKQQLLDSVWSNTVVTEEALSRTISRVRKQLNDNPRDPNLIQTLPKRGYRVIASPCRYLPSDNNNSKNEAEVSVEHNVKSTRLSDTPANKRSSSYAIGMVLAVLFAIGTIFFMSTDRSLSPSSNADDLIAQADVYYHRQTQRDNAMAIALYQQASTFNATLVEAYSGMANALVQQVIRTTQDDSVTWQQSSLTYALANGLTATDDAKQVLSRALTLAEKAITLEPQSARSHKAKGFVLSALGETKDAISSYEKALALNGNAWDVWVNLGGLADMDNDISTAIAHYTNAYTIVSEVELDNPIITPTWRADIGALVGEKYLVIGDLTEAETWFRRVLSFAPYNHRATVGLIDILQRRDQNNAAYRLCVEYEESTGSKVC